jgi:hypothetical protein
LQHQAIVAVLNFRIMTLLCGCLFFQDTVVDGSTSVDMHASACEPFAKAFNNEHAGHISAVHLQRLHSSWDSHWMHSIVSHRKYGC